MLNKGHCPLCSRNAPSSQPRPRQAQHPLAAGLIPLACTVLLHPAPEARRLATASAVLWPARADLEALCACGVCSCRGGCWVAIASLSSFAWLHSSSSRQCCAGFRGIKPFVSRPSHFVCEGQSLPFYSTLPLITGSAVLPVRGRLPRPSLASHQNLFLG